MWRERNSLGNIVSTGAPERNGQEGGRWDKSGSLSRTTTRQSTVLRAEAAIVLSMLVFVCCLAHVDFSN